MNILECRYYPILCLLILFTSCSSELHPFNKQKFTDLKSIGTIPSGNFFVADQPTTANQLDLQLSEVFALNLTDSNTETVISNETPETNKNPKSSLLHKSIQSKMIIQVICYKDTFQLLDASLDTVNNILRGELIPYQKISNQKYLEVILPGNKCGEIKNPGVKITHGVMVHERTAGITSESNEFPYIAPLKTSILNGSRIYVNTGSKVYIVHEPRFDSVNNEICGRWVEIQDEKINPHILIFTKLVYSKIPDDGCLSIFGINRLTEYSNSEIEYSSNRTKNKKYLTAGIVLLSIFSFGSGIFFLGVSNVNDKKLKELLTQFVVMTLIIGVVIFLALVLAYFSS